MASIIAVTNQKGGVGKTTTAINLAASLAASERRVLLIDGDPQGNASSGVGLTPDSVQTTLYDVLIDGSDPKDAIRHAVHFPSLDVLAATPDLAGAEVELVGEVGRELVLRRAIEATRDDYDFILIDCPPSLGLLTVNMLSAADSLIIPLQCEYFALEGLTQLLRTVNLVQQRLNSGLHIFGVLLTMYDARLNLSRQVADDAREYFGNLVFNTVIPRNIRLAEAPSFGRPIVTYDIASVGSAAYLSLAKEVIERSGMDVSKSPTAGLEAINSPSSAALQRSDDPTTPEPPGQSDTQPLQPVQLGKSTASDVVRQDTESAAIPTTEPQQGPELQPVPIDQLTDSPPDPSQESASDPSQDSAPEALQSLAAPTQYASSDIARHPGDLPAVVVAEQDPQPKVHSSDNPSDQHADRIPDRSTPQIGDNPAATTAP